MDITVCGCGWLGLPLTKHLILRGHDLVATKRSSQAVDELQTQNIAAFPFSLQTSVSEQLYSTLFKNRILILNIPSGRKLVTTGEFSTPMIHLIDRAFAQGLKGLVFVSTTSVYGDLSGRIDESAETLPVTQSGIEHVAIEQHIKQRYPAATILRLSGLMGADRHPVRYLSGRQAIAGGEQIINLIHQQDVVTAVTKIVENSLWSQVMHLSCHDHPRRDDYYVQAAKAFNLPLPVFANAPEASSGKYIDCTMTLDKLDMQLRYASVFDVLKSQK